MSSSADPPFKVDTPQGTIEILPPETGAPAQFATSPKPRVRLPIILFALTCLFTWQAGGWKYAAPLMGILLCHEFGHYLQARRYHEPASLPYFIPFPSLFGTMGAVIAMRSQMLNRKVLFDIGITGPLAGLVPALICCYVGLHWSQVVDTAVFQKSEHYVIYNEPLLFQWITEWVFGPLPPDKTTQAHPLAIAGWVGIFITALNLVPIGQLDGGHILYALLRTKAHLIATVLLFAAIGVCLVTGNLSWWPMLLLLFVFGPKHPPTLDDDASLGWGRTVLGWATLMFVIIGFTPVPIEIH